MGIVSPLYRELIDDMDNSPVERIIVIRGYCLIKAKRWGIAAGDGETSAAGKLRGKSLKEVAGYLLSDDDKLKCIGLAAINAGVFPREENLREINVRDLIMEKGRERKVAYIGHFSFLDNWNGGEEERMIFEMNPEKGDIPADEIPRLLPEADVAVITGMTLSNHTFENVMKSVRDDAYVILTGASSPLSEKLFDYGVDAVGGILFDDDFDAERLRDDTVNIRNLPGIRKVILMKS